MPIIGLIWREVFKHVFKRSDVCEWLEANWIPLLIHKLLFQANANQSIDACVHENWKKGDENALNTSSNQTSYRTKVLSDKSMCTKLPFVPTKGVNYVKYLFKFQLQCNSCTVQCYKKHGRNLNELRVDLIFCARSRDRNFPVHSEKLQMFVTRSRQKITFHKFLVMLKCRHSLVSLGQLNF